MYKVLRRLLFTLDPERAHHLTFRLLRIPGASWLAGATSARHPSLKKTVFGLTFPNPVGLAAGLDKDAVAFEQLGKLGFGFVEIGTITHRAQPGNEKPRLFRLKRNKALINRMGFNNQGADHAAKRLSKRSASGLIIGGNIGKNKITPNDQAVDDYIFCLKSLHPFVDYFVVNVSSPNTPHLRALQDREPLTRLLNALQAVNRTLKPTRPVLLKIAPDLTNEQLDDIISIVKETELSGVIATNTTVSRSGLDYGQEELEKIGPGGLSGVPLRERSTEVIRYLKQKSGNAFPVIGVGGIHSSADALEKLEAGADLVQLYTGFIYEGPKLIGDICSAILKKGNG